ncbi:MAG: UPF0175 family protein [Acidobacteria bacterium]|nr:UPF0175 family protein [Acidobacteriota bacterium]
MQVNIELPEDVSQALQRSWGDVPKHALATLAAEGYRSGALTESQIRRMLGLKTRIEVHAFLKDAGVHLTYAEDDLAEDLETHRRLGILPRR